MDRLTLTGAEGVKAFCSLCADKPSFGKCEIAKECYSRQVYLALRAYEDTGRDPSEIAALDHDVAKLQLTLQEIANPIKFLQQRADEQGVKLNGLFAINLATDAGYLKSLAKQALAEMEGANDN